MLMAGANHRYRLLRSPSRHEPCRHTFRQRFQYNSRSCSTMASCDLGLPFSSLKNQSGVWLCHQGMSHNKQVVFLTKLLSISRTKVPNSGFLGLMVSAFITFSGSNAIKLGLYNFERNSISPAHNRSIDRTTHFKGILVGFFQCFGAFIANNRRCATQQQKDTAYKREQWFP